MVRYSPVAESMTISPVLPLGEDPVQPRDHDSLQVEVMGLVQEQVFGKPFGIHSGDLAEPFDREALGVDEDDPFSCFRQDTEATTQRTLLPLAGPP